MPFAKLSRISFKILTFTFCCALSKPGLMLVRIQLTLASFFFMLRKEQYFFKEEDTLQTLLIGPRPIHQKKTKKPQR